ncbi:hypothetical protein ACQ4LE_005263 [Meloidogyne hapla]
MNILIYLLLLFIFRWSPTLCGKDYYEILDVDKNVTYEELGKSYRNLLLKYHPDRNPNDPDANKKTRDLIEAYNDLSGKIKMGEVSGVSTGKQGIPTFESLSLKIIVFNDKIVVIEPNQTLFTKTLYIKGSLKNQVSIYGNQIEFNEKNNKSPENHLKTKTIKIHLKGVTTSVTKLSKKYKFDEEDLETLPTPKETIYGSKNYFIDIYVEDEAKHLLNHPLMLHSINNIHIEGKENLVVIIGS